MNTKNLPLLAVIGIGAYLLLNRNAGAAGLLGTLPTIASRPPRVYGSSPTAAIMPIQRPAGDQGLIAAGINALSSWWSMGSAPLTRTAGWTPGYFPDNEGEAVARDYVINNPDAFAVNPPTSFNDDPQAYVSTGGYLDSQ